MLDFKLHSPQGAFTLDIDAQLPATGISAVFGPSGSGKTTLLRCLAGLTDCTGHISFNEDTWLDTQNKINLAPHLRPVGYVFQDSRLFSHLNVAGNLEFAQRRAHHPIRCKREDVIAMLDLAPLLERHVEALSGGEQQRVAIARTLLNQPEVLLLDEPLSALDLARKAELLPYIRRVCRELKLPGIFVSHAIEEVAQLADHMVLIKDGSQLSAGATQDILEHPQLAKLISRLEQGAMIHAQVMDYDAEFQLALLACNGATLTVPVSTPPEKGARVRLFIRARDVSVATVKPTHSSVRNILCGELTEVSADQSTPFAELTIAVGDQLIHARVTRAAVAELGLSKGDTVFALVKSVSFDRD